MTDTGAAGKGTCARLTTAWGRCASVCTTSRICARSQWASTRVESARRYLAIDHAAAAITAHRLVVERLRALTRRRGDRRWRLIGLSIPALGAEGSKRGGGERKSVMPPPLAEWAESHGLEDWSEAELQMLYAEAFPVTDRTAARNERMRERQRALLFELEQLAAETPQSSDLVSGWFEDAVAKRLIGAGWITLGDLRQRIARGGRWWRALSGVGASRRRVCRRISMRCCPQSRRRRTRPAFTFRQSVHGQCQPP